MRPQDASFYKFKKWAAVLAYPAIVGIWIASDYYDNYLYKTGKRKTFWDQIREKQEKEFPQQYALQGLNSPYVKKDIAGRPY